MKPVSPPKFPGPSAPKPSLSDSDKGALENLNRRLAVIRDRVRGVAEGLSTGLYLFGPPGSSKTFTIRNTLESLNVPNQYVIGHLTPMGLFDLIAQNDDRILVLDDVSQILGQATSIQILLAALGQPDDKGARVVRYKRRGHEEKVHFSGGIICVSNLELQKSALLQALKSRLHYLCYDPSDEEIAALMRQIAMHGWPQNKPTLTPDECLEVTEYLIAESKRLTSRLDIRNLVDKGFPDFFQHRCGHTETHWKDLVTTTLEEGVRNLRHSSSPIPKSRTNQKEEEYRVIRQILEEFQSPQERLTAWNARTKGKSSRAFYRRCKELGTEHSL